MNENINVFTLNKKLEKLNNERIIMAKRVKTAQQLFHESHEAYYNTDWDVYGKDQYKVESAARQAHYTIYNNLLEEERKYNKIIDEIEKINQQLRKLNEVKQFKIVGSIDFFEGVGNINLVQEINKNGIIRGIKF